MSDPKIKTLVLALCIVVGPALLLAVALLGIRSRASDRQVAAPVKPNSVTAEPKAIEAQQVVVPDSPKRQEPSSKRQDPPAKLEPKEPPREFSRPISPVRRANYDRLETNMGYSEVEQILGPGKELSRAGGTMTVEWYDPDSHVRILLTFSGAVPGFEPQLVAKSIRD